MSQFLDQLTQRIAKRRQPHGGEREKTISESELDPILSDADTRDWIETYRASSGMKQPTDDRDMLLRA